MPGSNTTFQPVSLGLTGEPRLENGQLALVYQHGDFCDGAPRNTTIELICGEGLGSPVFIDEDPACNYIFSWATSVACDVKSDEGSDCHVTDDSTGQRIDLTGLAARGPFHVGAPEGGYDIGLCKAADKCAPGVGACSGSNNFGRASSQLEVDDGVVTLTYNNGGKCEDGATRTTLIEFRCVCLLWPLGRTGICSF